MESESNSKTNCNAVESQELDFDNNDIHQDIKIEIKQELVDSIPDNSGNIEDFLVLQFLDGYGENKEESCIDKQKKQPYIRRSLRKRRKRSMFTSKKRNSKANMIKKQSKSKNESDTDKRNSNSTFPGSGILCLCPYCKKFTVVNIDDVSTDNLCNGNLPADYTYESDKNKDDKLSNKNKVISQCRYCYQTFVTTVEKGKNGNCFKTKKGVVEPGEISVKEEVHDEDIKNVQIPDETLSYFVSNSVGGMLPETLAVAEENSFCMSNENNLNSNKQKKSRKVHKCPTCNKEFFGKYRLNRHELTHTGYRPFKCLYCEMRFSVKDKVLRHERNIHKMDPVYKCSKCDKRFTSDIRCSEHEAIHKDDVKNLLECEICKKTFNKKYRHVEHMNSHTGNRPFKCRFCEKCFYSKDKVSSHEVTHLENRPLFKCSYCDKMFVTDGGKKEHEIIKHTGGKQGLTCDYCGKIFLSFWKLTTHLRSHTGDRPFSCSYCDKSFGTKHRLNAHENVHTGDRQYKCSQCDMTFLTSKRLKLHEKKHPLYLPYTCNYCGSKFGTKMQLSTHEITHYTVLPYLCEFCDKKFATEDELKEHDKTHAIEEQFPCNICGKLYNNKPSLTAHEKLHVEDRSGNQCSYCGLSCFNAKSLKIHEMRHTGERPFKCRFCDKRYITGNRCRMHEKTHNDEDWQYLCSYCGKKFFAKSKVESHEFTHTGLRPHKCEICGVAFNKLYNLTAHYKIHKKNLATSFTCTICAFYTSRKSLLNKHVQKHGAQILNHVLSNNNDQR